jgi:hypothetical protein
MKMSKMNKTRTFVIMLSDITNQEDDAKFAEYIEENNFEYWRRTPLNWILLTPQTTTLEEIINATHNAYGQIFISAFRVNILGYGGAYRKLKSNLEESPFKWFNDIKDENFIPKWEAKEQKELK